MLDLNAALVNRMLAGRVKDMAGRKPGGSKDAQAERAVDDIPRLQKALGLFPTPARPDLQPQVVATLAGEGYRTDVVQFSTDSEERTTATVYSPGDVVAHPSVVFAPDGDWANTSPWAQSLGIGLSLLGYVCVVLDPPRDATPPAYQSLGYSVLGRYVWRILRALDYCETRTDAHVQKAGVAGCGFGGYAALMAAARDTRITCAAVSGCNGSLELLPNLPPELKGLSGIAGLGDISDISALRAPMPLLLMGGMNDPETPVPAQIRTRDKVKQLYRPFRAEDFANSELFVSGKDFNRRMRESAYAFFGEHLKLMPATPYLPEARPLTDGRENPFPCGTLPKDSAEWGNAHAERAPEAKEIVLRLLENPYPEEVDFRSRLVGWGQYGKVQITREDETLRLSDTPGPDVTLPFEEVDQSLSIALGLAVPEVFAQLIHLSLPGGEEGWEQAALAGHALTSMFASVKTLVSGTGNEVVLKRVEASGPRSSLTAWFLKLYRPQIELHTTHQPESWLELAKRGDPLLFMPGARYTKWPFHHIRQEPSVSDNSSAILDPVLGTEGEEPGEL